MKMQQSKIHSLFLLCLLFPLELWSQTVVWQMQPRDWSELTRVGANLYKAVGSDGRIGLLRADGSEVMPPTRCQLHRFHDGKALITQTATKGERVTGCLTDDGQYYAFTSTYYTLSGQQFYSNDLLTVSDEQGHLGYIDQQGQPQVGFDKGWTRIKPFTEEHAVVVSGKHYALINKQGEEQRLVIGGTGVGEISSCTNAYHGVVYAYDSYNEKFYIYDLRTKAPMKASSFMKGKDKATDYLYCFQAVSGRGKDVPFESFQPYKGQQGAIPQGEGGRYGYTAGDRTVLPFQFSNAEMFQDNLATVSLSTGLRGVLRWVDGSSFDAVVTQASLDFYSGDNVQCQFTLSVPEAWHGKSLEVELQGEGGNTILLRNNGASYTFTQTPAKSQECHYTVNVHGEGLHLFRGTLAYTFTHKERPVSHPTGTKPPTEKICPDCGKPISKCPVRGNHYKAY